MHSGQLVLVILRYAAFARHLPTTALTYSRRNGFPGHAAILFILHTCIVGQGSTKDGDVGLSSCSMKDTFIYFKQ